MSKEMGRKETVPLRSVKDLVNANEWLFNKQNRGEIDAKTADAMNTTWKGQKALIADLPLKAFQIAVQAMSKRMKVDPEVFKRLGLPQPVLPPPEET